MNVLAIGAHPDDVEILCGGTLARYAREGHTVWVAVATNGNVGSPTLSREAIAAVRRREAEAACAVIGARLIWLDFDDEWLFNDRPTRERFLDAIREARPQVMFIHGSSDYHPDHRAAGQIALDARIPSAVRLVETNLPALEQIPHVFVMDNVAGIDFVPELYVDVTETLETKSAMLAMHRSQDEWLQHLYGLSYIEFMTTHTRRRGAEAGVDAAEAFREVKTYPPTGSADLLPGPVVVAPTGDHRAA